MSPSTIVFSFCFLTTVSPALRVSGVSRAYPSCPGKNKGRVTPWTSCLLGYRESVFQGRQSKPPVWKGRRLLVSAREPRMNTPGLPLHLAIFSNSSHTKNSSASGDYKRVQHHSLFFRLSDNAALMDGSRLKQQPALATPWQLLQFAFSSEITRSV